MSKRMDARILLALLFAALLSALAILVTQPLHARPNARVPNSIGGCNVFPADSIWNTRIDTLAAHPNSTNFVNRIGANAGLHPDFGTAWNNAPNGIPFIVVPTNQPLRAITLTPYGNEADPGPYPVPTNAIVEGGMSSNGDRHLLIVRQGDCKLFEMYRAFPNADGSWKAYGAKFDLNSNALRTDGWTSADAAGLAILPGLVKYDEVQSALAGDGVIHHALRFTVPQAHYSYLWPARHRTNTSDNPNDPPMGLRFRLKANFNISGFSASNQVILRTLKQYGMFVADNGSAFYLSGAPDARWDDDDLHDLQTSVHGYDFEAVDESGLMVTANSGQAKQSGGSTPTHTATRTATRTPTRTGTPIATATPCAALPAPGLIAPVHNALLTTSTVKLNWNKRMCATRYRVQVRQDTTAKPNLVNLYVNTRKYSASLTPQHDYYWRVRACNATTCGAWTGWWKFRIQ